MKTTVLLTFTFMGCIAVGAGGLHAESAKRTAAAANNKNGNTNAGNNASPDAAALSPNAQNPDAYSLKTYRLASYDLVHGFVTRERGQLHAPPMPKADASAAEIEKFLRLSNEVASQYLGSEMGIPLVQGSLAAYDPVSQTLAVRAPNSTQDILTSYEASYLNRLPQYLALNIHVVEADTAVLRGMIKEAATTAEHRALWERLQGLIAEGKAKDLGELRLDTRSGQRASIERGERRKYGMGFSLGENGWFEVPKESRTVGTTLEVDPVIGPDGRTVDLSFALKHDIAPPLERWSVVTNGGPKRVETQVTDFRIANVTTAITLDKGMTHLMGVWTPRDSLEAEHGDRLQAGFITCDVVPLLPHEDNRIAELLKTYGEKIVPTPPPGAHPPVDSILHSGMVVRRFRVPPDFLSSSGAGAESGMAPAAPPDPFASRAMGGAAAAPRNEAHAMRSVTAMDVLRAAGITFPEGSSANFSAATGELVVRNLPQNAELVEAFVDTLLKKVPQSVVFSFSIVQADAKTLNDIAAQTSKIADHTAAWKVIEDAVAQGRAKILNTSWLETRSGQRAAIEAGTEYMTPGDLELADLHPKSGPVSSPAPGKDGAAPAPAKLGDATPGGIGSTHESAFVGFKVEVDPVIGPDGETIDLSFAINYDYASPVPFASDLAAPEKTLRTSAPDTRFHKANFSTAITLSSGMTRLLGIWKPEGTPDFDKGEVLQAAFMKADIVHIAGDDAKK